MKNKTYLLIDRSGSMGPLWNEAIGSINAFVETLEDKESGVYVAIFDSQSFDVIRNSTVATYDPIGIQEYQPRGMTPLYDAVGRTLSLAEGEANELTSIVVMTDGFENASKEYNLKSVQAKIDAAKSRNWTVNFLGAEFKDVGQVSGSLGVGVRNTRNLERGKLKKGLEQLGTMRNTYAATGMSATMSWGDDD
jgi:uncharacterized protein with von Willebrand factor type A (vWA) domain